MPAATGKQWRKMKICGQLWSPDLCNISHEQLVSFRPRLLARGVPPRSSHNGLPIPIPIYTIVKNWLETNLPQWADFKVKGSSRYLGFMLGPSAGKSQWTLALDKWNSRSVSFADIGAAASIAAKLYNTRAVSTLGYIAQLRQLPCSARAIERRIVNKILRLLGNALGAREFLNLSVLNGPHFTSVCSFACAAAIQAATVTVLVWPGALATLVQAA